MPTWYEFAWATFLYSAMGGDRDYQGILNRTELLNRLRSNPEAALTGEIQQNLIKGFLNRWKCRVRNTPQSARAVRTKLHEMQPYLQALDNLGIEDINFGQAIYIDGEQMTVEECIKHCYLHMTIRRYRMFTTGVSKLLHILQPKLFVMWDKDILEHYKKIDDRVSNEPEGYCIYLHLMQDMAKQVTQGFRHAMLNPPAGANESVAVYLSARMNYNPPKTMAKYLDEYNWVTVTNKAQVPPSWYPCER